MTAANEKPDDLIRALDDLREENRMLREAKGWPPLTGEITVYGLTLAEIRKLKHDSLRRAQTAEAVDEAKIIEGMKIAAQICRDALTFDEDDPGTWFAEQIDDAINARARGGK